MYLAADIKHLGSLQEFSAFVFESKLGQLKNLVPKPQYPIQQVLKRLDEHALYGTLSFSTLAAPVTKIKHCDGPLLPSFKHVLQYRRLQTDKFTISLSAGNKCIRLKSGIQALVKNTV